MRVIIVAPTQQMAELWLTETDERFTRKPTIVTSPLGLRGMSHQRVIVVEGASRLGRQPVKVSFELWRELSVLQDIGAITVELQELP